MVVGANSLVLFAVFCLFLFLVNAQEYSETTNQLDDSFSPDSEPFNDNSEDESPDLQDIVNDASDHDETEQDIDNESSDLNKPENNKERDLELVQTQVQTEFDRVRDLLQLLQPSNTSQSSQQVILDKLSSLSEFFSESLRVEATHRKHEQKLKSELSELKDKFESEKESNSVDYDTGDVRTPNGTIHQEPDGESNEQLSHDPALLQEDLRFLADLVAVIGASAIFGAFAVSLSIPIVIGFIIGGIFVGPSCLAIVVHMERIDTLAQVGAALILFAQGLEFESVEMDRFRKLSCWMFFVQIFVNGFLFTVVLRMLGIAEHSSEIMLLSLSSSLCSSTVATNLASEHHLLRGSHAQLLSAMLVGQDLLMGLFLCFPEALRMGFFGIFVLARQIIYATILVSASIYVSTAALPKITSFMLREENPQLYLLSCLCICLGATFISLCLGLSGEFGAFFAGLTLTRTRMHHETMARIQSTKNLFSALLFASIGMLISPHFILKNIPSIVSLLVFVLLIKFSSSYLTLKSFGRSTHTAFLGSLGVCQIAEFSMILAGKGYLFGLVSRHNYLVFLSTAVLSLILNPLLFNRVVNLNFVQFQQIGKVISLEETGSHRGGGNSFSKGNSVGDSV